MMIVVCLGAIACISLIHMIWRDMVEVNYAKQALGDLISQLNDNTLTIEGQKKKLEAMEFLYGDRKGQPEESANIEDIVDRVSKQVMSSLSNSDSLEVLPQSFQNLYQTTFEKIKAKFESTQKASSSPAKVNNADLYNMIDDRISKWVEGDRLDKVDYALYAQGAQVILHSKEYHEPESSSFWRRFIFHSNGPTASGSELQTPKIMLFPIMIPNACYCFSGNAGWFVIQFKEPIPASEFVLQHISDKIVADISDAPGDLKLFSWSSKTRKNIDEIGSMMYSPRIDGTMLSTKLESSSPIQHLNVSFSTNQGGEKTCIYRVRVHGE